MNRARWITSAATFLVLWLMGALVLAPGLQRNLEQAAKTALEHQSSLDRRLAGLSVTFAGQQARLAGSVRTAHDRQAIVQTVRDLRTRAPLLGVLGLELNPVASVRDDIEIKPNPPGWLMLAAKGAEARLLGSAANEFEARDLARSIQENWSAQGGRVEGLPGIAAEVHDEAANVSTSLRGVPPPRTAASAHVARIGAPWQTLVLEKPDAMLREQALSMGITEAEWTSDVLPALRGLREVHAQQRQEEEQQRRLAALPPGHLFVATRDSEVTLRGEVAEEAVKRDLLDKAILVFSPFRVHDEIRVNSRRRPGDDFASLSTALLPVEKGASGKALFLAMDHEAWKAVDWQVSSDAQPWKESLPDGMDAHLLAEDSAALINWLQGAARPATVGTTRPAFITLALFDGRAVLCGQVAEESTRVQIIAATRRAYAPDVIVTHDDLLVDGSCRPFRGVLHTVKSLPPPPRSAAEGIFAIATPAESWILLPTTADLVEAGGLARTGRFSTGLPAGLVEERSHEAIEQMRDWRYRLHPQPSLH